MKVSKFNNIFSKHISNNSLSTELSSIKNGEYKFIIEKCRKYVKEGNYDAYKSSKIKLPIVTFCGTFKNGRKLENLENYNNLMILDIDNLSSENVKNVRDTLSQDKYIHAVWASPSNQGLKALIKIESSPEEHKLSFKSLQKYFKKNYNITLDNSGSDVTRLCFVSYDKELYYNKNSEIYRDKSEEVKISKNKVQNKINKSLTKSAFATEGLNKKEHRKIIQQIIKFLRNKDKSITHTFDQWLRVALGISNTFSYDLGEKYFLSICELDKERHNELKSKNLLMYCYNNRNLSLDSSITLGTILFFAKEKGFKTKKDRLKKQ